MDREPPTGPDDTLVLQVQLPRGAARIEVAPRSLAPWTEAFFARTPRGGRGGKRFRIEADPGGVALQSPAGRFVVDPQDAESSWDALLRSLLKLRTGPPLLHAALVARDPHSAVLLVGPSGVGKTTLALALGARGWEVDADDWVHVGARGPRGVGRPLDTVPAGAALTWRYAHTRAPDGAFAHAAAAAPPRRPWSAVRAVVRLDARRGGPPRLERLGRPALDDLWVLPPRIRDVGAAFRLFFVPWWGLRGGSPDEAAARLAAQFARAR